VNKFFYEVCYEILSQYLNFPDVADTYKSIIDGIDYCNQYYQIQMDFDNRKYEVINYITKVRKNNIIDAYQNRLNPLMLVPLPDGKTLVQSSPQELYKNLQNEIPRLIVKGIHQIIKHFNEMTDDNALIAELLQEDVNTLVKYNLWSEING
jgi:hypothetical protein